MAILQHVSTNVIDSASACWKSRKSPVAYPHLAYRLATQANLDGPSLRYNQPRKWSDDKIPIIWCNHIRKMDVAMFIELFKRSSVDGPMTVPRPYRQMVIDMSHHISTSQGASSRGNASPPGTRGTIAQGPEVMRCWRWQECQLDTMLQSLVSKTITQDAV